MKAIERRARTIISYVLRSDMADFREMPEQLIDKMYK